MHFENRASVSASREALWAFLMDIPEVARCIPGVDEINQVDGDHYTGVMKIRVGPIALRFSGRMAVTQRDAANSRATMQAEGTDKGAGGGVKATVNMTLREIGPTETELTVITDADVLGRIGQFGQPLMRSKADAIMREFAANVGQRVGTAG